MKKLSTASAPGTLTPPSLITPRQHQWSQAHPNYYPISSPTSPGINHLHHLPQHQYQQQHLGETMSSASQINYHTYGAGGNQLSLASGVVVGEGMMEERFREMEVGARVVGGRRCMEGCLSIAQAVEIKEEY